MIRAVELYEGYDLRRTKVWLLSESCGPRGCVMCSGKQWARVLTYGRREEGACGVERKRERRDEEMQRRGEGMQRRDEGMQRGMQRRNEGIQRRNEEMQRRDEEMQSSEKIRYWM